VLISDRRDNMAPYQWEKICPWADLLGMKQTYRNHDIIGPVDQNNNRLIFFDGRHARNRWYVKTDTGHLVPCESEVCARTYVDFLWSKR
jgi:hypothetical protein